MQPSLQERTLNALLNYIATLESDLRTLQPPQQRVLRGGSAGSDIVAPLQGCFQEVLSCFRTFQFDSMHAVALLKQRLDGVHCLLALAPANVLPALEQK